MQGLVYTAPNVVEVRDLPPPEASAGSVRLRVDAAGICGSDLHAFKGHDPRRVPPMVLGHEFVGTAMDGALAGRRFTANPMATCGTCRFCIQGRGNLCTNRRMIGMDLAGAFADQVAVPQGCLVEVPSSLPDRAAALTEPAATVVHALALGARALTRPLAEQRVLVIGAGAIGLLAVLALRGHGVRDLEVAETSPLRADALLAATGIRVRTGAATDPDGFDMVVDAVGMAATRDLAIASAAPGGVVVHVGLGDWTSPLDWRTLTLREITLVGCYTYAMADVHAALHLLGSGFFGDLDWVEERALSAGPAAFADLTAGRAAAPKILLRPGA